MHQTIHFQKEEPTLGIWGTTSRLGSVTVSNVLYVPMPQSTVPGQAQSSGEARAGGPHQARAVRHCWSHYSAVTLLRH